MFKFKRLIAVLYILSIIFTVPVFAAESKQKSDNFVSLPIGTGEGYISYSNLSGEGQNFGPESFIINKNEIFILDSVEKQIEIFDLKGSYLDTLNLPNDNIYLDIAIKTNGNIIVLTENGMIIELNKEGNIIFSKVGLSLENKRSGYGRLLSLYTNKNNEIVIRDLKEGHEINIEDNKINKGFDSTFVITEKDSKKLNYGYDNIKVNNVGIEPILNINGDLIVIEEVNPFINYEKKIKKYSNNKQVKEYIVESIDKYVSFPHRDIYASKNSSVYQMVCTKVSINIVELTEADNISLSIEPTTSNLNNMRNVSILSATYEQRAAAIDKAYEMVNHTWTYNPATMKTPTTSTTTPPDHLRGTSIITVTGIPYKWGGFDNISAFTSNIAAGKTAGDINSSAVVSSTTGIDCSGFVSRAYGLTTKLGTSTMYTQFDPIDIPEYGDIMNRPNSHVFMVEAHEYSGYDGHFIGYWTVESTDQGYGDGAKAYFQDADYASNFTPMRKK